MDAATKPPRTGLRRPPHPGPPRLSSGNQLLLLLWRRLLRVQGCKPCWNTPSRTTGRLPHSSRPIVHIRSRPPGG
ncbi:hypothetical protein FJU31_03680 [Stenotrophomonas cyclobalanopsidis]|uniref:Uncharacterized protein n=1 Tax=Stenotrophomonas cyclobalanopsidis TaxID=2771362 RepID=A0ABQ6T403_9GAMM|nr:hypothetical protein FJU31_03680 [Stenotrophomonas cyclobalanopsidis]